MPHAVADCFCTTPALPRQLLHRAARPNTFDRLAPEHRRVRWMSLRHREHLLQTVSGCPRKGTNLRFGHTCDDGQRIEPLALSVVNRQPRAAGRLIARRLLRALARNARALAHPRSVRNFHRHKHSSSEIAIVSATSGTTISSRNVDSNASAGRLPARTQPLGQAAQRVLRRRHDFQLAPQRPPSLGVPCATTRLA